MSIDLAVPPTEAEVAEALANIDVRERTVFRKLAIQRDRLLAERDALREQLSELRRSVVTSSWLSERDRAVRERDELRAEYEVACDRFRKKSARLSDALNLLREWRNTPFFVTEADWRLWCDEFGSRVDAVLAGKSGSGHDPN